MGAGDVDLQEEKNLLPTLPATFEIEVKSVTCRKTIRLKHIYALHARSAASCVEDLQYNPCPMSAAGTRSSSRSCRMHDAPLASPLTHPGARFGNFCLIMVPTLSHYVCAGTGRGYHQKQHTYQHHVEGHQHKVLFLGCGRGLSVVRRPWSIGWC